ncbi:FCS-Like Zinc finger 5-like [Lycium ferocissimum]|uniref:FCS-Like Zinc finger 5-like n=1 Tax=Lycium ferocissimum TaxID=112874 RepID=UPI002814F8DD|nr:FCS-Like Zinc finger 5-like [Lycium ferocissimum]
MMLGKRGRPPMRRTTSMTGITFDLGTASEQEPPDYNPKDDMVDDIKGGYDYHEHEYDSVPLMVSPRYQKRVSGEGFKRETSSFLRSCGLCNRRLGPGRDIYMYRGETAFCSMECREEQMKEDERKDKSNIKPNSRSTANHHSEFPSATTSESSSNGKTVAAA